MNAETRHTLAASPDELLLALQSAVAQHANWRLLSGRSDDAPRFVVEKRVRYELVRGGAMMALYQVIGSLDRGADGVTTLRYSVSGQPEVPFLSAAITIGILLAVTVLVGIAIFSPPLAGNPVGVLLVGVLLVGIVLYGLYAFRAYRGHLNELRQFMESFAQQWSVGGSTR